MALLKGSVNPLNVVGQRRLSYIPEHFSKMKISDAYQIEKIDQWIYYNLNSRYCVKLKWDLDDSRKFADVCEIGVEDPKELTMLSLACPYLNRNKKEY
jgi:hypothetical protein